MLFQNSKLKKLKLIFKEMQEVLLKFYFTPYVVKHEL